MEPSFYGPTYPVPVTEPPPVGAHVAVSYRIDNTGERREDAGMVTRVLEGNFGPRNPAGAMVPVVYLDNGNSYRLDAAALTLVTPELYAALR